MGYRDLARFQYRTGDLPGAVRSYTKSREFCTTSNHVLEMCLGVIEVALDMANYAFVRNYVVKAESALEGAQAASSGGKSKAAPVNLPGMVAPAQDPIEAAKERERKSVHERLTVAGGVGHLGSSAYNKAAHAFTDIGSEALVSGPGHVRYFVTSYPFDTLCTLALTMRRAPRQFIPPADIALYATLTSLACFTRSALKTRVLENPGLRPFLDLEPYLRDIVRAFYDSRFKVGLELLHKHEVCCWSLSTLRAFETRSWTQERALCYRRWTAMLTLSRVSVRRPASTSTCTSRSTSTLSSAPSRSAPSWPTSRPSRPSPSRACRRRSAGPKTSCRAPSST